MVDALMVAFYLSAIACFSAMLARSVLSIKVAMAEREHAIACRDFVRALHAKTVERITFDLAERGDAE